MDTNRSRLVCLLFLVLLGAAPLWAEKLDSFERLTYSLTIDADREAVWRAFSTEKGFRLWMAPLVSCPTWEVGGTIRSNYNPSGEIGDPQTIELTILAYDPGRMLALKTTGFPQDFPWKDSSADLWTVFYLQDTPSGGTQVTCVGLGYTESPEHQEIRKFFEAGNAQVLKQLKKVLEDGT